eukprot:14410180-Alexandrium_andersonii.AAC.1
MSASLVGSEMCIRDRLGGQFRVNPSGKGMHVVVSQGMEPADKDIICLLYTSTLPTICSV